jgi:hypothetical protein
MNEQRLRDALHAEVDELHAAPGAFERLEQRLGMKGRSAEHSALLVGVAVVLVVALTVGAVALARDPSSRRVPAGPALGGMPRRVLAITDRNQPVVLDARTGRVLTRYESHSVAAGTQVAVAPDGRSFYFVDGIGNEGCQDHSILRFGLAPGIPGQSIADDASEPAISPDGRYLAFYRCTGGDAAGAARPDQLVVRDLRLGGDRVLVPPPGTFFGERLIFDADSRHLIYEAVGLPAAVATDLRRVDLSAGSPMPGLAFGVAQRLVGALDSGARYLVVAPHVENRKRQAGDLVASVGPDPAVPGVRSEAFEGWFWLPSDVTSAAADRTGRHAVAVSRSTLYRWSRGDAEPTKLRDGIVAAAWIPDRAADRSPRAIATIGGAGVPRNTVRFLDPRDGVELGRAEVGPDPVTHVAATPDGRLVIATVPQGGSDCDGTTELVDLATGRRERLLGEAVEAVVNRHGLAAYAIHCDGVTLGFTDLVSGENSRSDPLGRVRSDVTGLRVLGWSPNGKWLLYRLRSPDRTQRFYASRLWPAVRQSRKKVVALPSGGGIVGAAFLDNNHIALAEPGGHEEVEVRRWKIGTRGREVPSPVVQRLPELPTVLRTDAGGTRVLAVGTRLAWWRVGDGALHTFPQSVTDATWMP